MVKYTWHVYLLFLSIFSVILQLESVSLGKTRSGRRSYFDWLARILSGGRHKLLKFASTNDKKLLSKDVPGFSLSDDEIRKFKMWPDGFIPYYIDVTSFNDKVLRDKIRSYLNMINSITSLNFVELPNPPEDDHTRWVFFINRKGLLGCADHSVWDFTSEGVQRVVLGYDCMNKEGELPEAVLAIAGVPAQHTAPDRDEYIKVFEDNVIPDKRKLFEKLSNSDWLFHDLPYDYNSVGHYHNFKYSMNGKTVIEPRNPDITIGETKELSELDILKIRLLYNFITQQKQLDVPECQKLFKTGSKFNSFVPDQNIAKPKRKPAKYTGDQPNINSDVEYIDDDKYFSEKQSAENDDQGTDDYVQDLSAENPKSNETLSAAETESKEKLSAEELKSNETLSAAETGSKEKLSAEEPKSNETLNTAETGSKEKLSVEEPKSNETLSAAETESKEKLSAEELKSNETLNAAETGSKEKLSAEEPKSNETLNAEETKSEEELSAEETKMEDRNRQKLGLKQKRASKKNKIKNDDEKIDLLAILSDFHSD